VCAFTTLDSCGFQERQKRDAGLILTLADAADPLRGKAHPHPRAIQNLN
jgi:hypothetical protein